MARRNETDRWEQAQARSESIYREHEKATFWSRLAIAAFYTVFLLTLVWAIPWLPYGTQPEDYTRNVVAALILAGFAAIFAVVAIRLRGRMRRTEETLVTLTTVHHGLIDLRRREHFFNRMLDETRLAVTAQRPLGLVVLRFSPCNDVDSELRQLHRGVEAVESLVPSFDCIAVIGPHEIAALVPDTGPDRASLVAERFRRLAQEAQPLEERVDVRAGWACSLPGETEPGAIISRARGMLQADGANARIA